MKKIAVNFCFFLQNSFIVCSFGWAFWKLSVSELLTGILREYRSGEILSLHTKKYATKKEKKKRDVKPHSLCLLFCLGRRKHFMLKVQDKTRIDPLGEKC